MKRIVLFLLFIIGIASAHGQNFLSWKLNDRYFSVQTGIGFASYRGELKHNGSIQNEISNINLAFEARLLPKLSARVELARYSIRGHDKHAADSSFARQRNLSFESNNYELTVQGVFFLKKYKGDYYKRWKVDPYLLAGIGTTFISPQATLQGQTYNLYELKTEDTNYSRFTLIIPVGVGLKWRVTPFINFITEINYRFTFSDYLDDVSGDFPAEYPDITPELLSNRKDEIEIVNEEAYTALTSGNPRGNSSKKDAYLFLNLKLEFFLPPSLFHK